MKSKRIAVSPLVRKRTTNAGSTAEPIAPRLTGLHGYPGSFRFSLAGANLELFEKNIASRAFSSFATANASISSYNDRTASLPISGSLFLDSSKTSPAPSKSASFHLWIIAGPTTYSAPSFNTVHSPSTASSATQALQLSTASFTCTRSDPLALGDQQTSDHSLLHYPIFRQHLG